MENWKQFSLYSPGCRNTFYQRQVLYGFLPAFLEQNASITLWHLLFEPSALIRVQADDLDSVLLSAAGLASQFGLEFSEGDCSSDWNADLVWPGVEYHGEAEFYGESLWRANADFMQSCGALSIEIAKLEPGKQIWMHRKFVHLLLNILGLSVLEEAAFHQLQVAKRLEIYEKYGNI